MISSRSSCLRLRLPRPRTFLGLMSLQTGTELIALALLFNKATGIYGLLTLATGYPLNALQITTYLMSVSVIAVLAYCLPHIRKGTPFQNVLLAFVYAVDTLISAAYTVAFATSWYLHLKEIQTAALTGNDGVSLTRRQDADEEFEMIVDTEFVDAAQLGAGQMDTVQQDSIDTAFSMVLIVGFTLIRTYFALVVLAYARTALLRFVDERIPEGDQQDGDDKEDICAPNPFEEGNPLSEGWQGKVGRFMLSVGTGYWLGGRKQDEEWARHVQSKFRSSRL
ncbi:Inositolphosphorylceramide synthase subunit Kei1-domain-containing protein [Podospora australis]|uniref:Inositolphosphorylceramide synthase subunit Kei1-domain-containing protein n=1 Tax=Podospora australis TaxID=1536484 RepID=A0AAN7AKD8_9PEZI|nr:Inositolphosphorylceramide synthase subunit Kei1-domain-containing protein [Podospora australis]